MNKLRLTKKKHLQPIQGKRFPVQEDLIKRFLAHVLAFPDQTAILTSDSSLTYQALYVDVLRLKALLCEKVHDRVVICLARTPTLLATLIALQWLDITYIPISRATPPERLRTIIEDSQAQALLFDGVLAEGYEALPCLLLNLSDVECPAVSECSLKATPLPKKNSLAYIIYTSGSTGKPKGVKVSRVALNNFLTNMSQHFLNEDQALLLATTTVGFDIAVLELFLPLWNQKTLFLANDDEHKDPLCIKELLDKYPITLLQSTPAMWNMLHAVGWHGKPGLVALCGGEPLTRALAQRLLAEVSALWNMYGPTEATVWCSIKQIKINEPITVGKPIGNMEMRVMDASNHLLPPYVKGELFVGGLGLAEGYVNNPALTSARFVACKGAINGRLYGVGDIACVTPEGEFIIFGRTDNQIKLHGYRIELEEIEAQILLFPGVFGCAVAVYEEQLVAYLSLSDRTHFSEDQLFQHLMVSLPGYMIPKRVILLEKLPLSNSGKIDRKALPVPSKRSTSSTTELLALTPTQLSLIAIWSEELKLSTISIHDNFFDLGGHSLLAARIIARISQQIGKHITLANFYNAPTIEQFGLLVDQTEKSEPLEKKLVRMDHRWLPLNDFQLMLWASRVFEPQLKKMNVVARKRLQGPLDKVALDLALQVVIQKNEVLSYKINRLYPLQRQCRNIVVKWTETSLVHLDAVDSESVLCDSLSTLFYHHSWRSKASMIVAKLFYLKDNQNELQVCLSHLVADERSLDIFFQELSNAYLYFANHQVVNATESFQPFRSYVLHQQHLFNEYSESDATFWSHYLVDAGFFCFPEKYILKELSPEKAPFTTYIEIPDRVLINVRQFCVHQQLTLSDVLCGAISLALKICTKDQPPLSHQLFMNTVKSTRDNPHYDSVIGCFLRIHPIKLDLSEGQTLVAFAKQAQRSTLETTEYQRASSLLKLAAIGRLPCKKSLLKPLLHLLASPVFRGVLRYLHVNQTILKACATLATIDRKANFLINVNILNNFFSEQSTPSHATLFGVPSVTTPDYPYPITVVQSVFDVCFLRNSETKRPLVAITANLTAAFREQFGHVLLDVLSQVEATQVVAPEDA